MIGERARNAEASEPQQGVANRRAVLAPHQLLHVLARHRTGVPLRRDQPLVLGRLRVGAHQAVVSLHRRDGHASLPSTRTPSATAPIIYPSSPIALDGSIARLNC